MRNITIFFKMAKFKIFIFCSILALIFGCNKNNQDRPLIPYTPINRQININDPLYSDLKIIGGHVYLHNDGARGVIVVHDYFDNIIALERNCPYNSSDECSRVTVEKNRATIRCGQYDGTGEWIACCNSKFNLEGLLLEGPSQYSLLKYNVSRSGDILLITN